MARPHAPHLPNQVVALHKDLGQVRQSGAGLILRTGEQGCLQEAMPLLVCPHALLLKPIGAAGDCSVRQHVRVPRFPAVPQNKVSHVTEEA